jgi:hypothetical protein
VDDVRVPVAYKPGYRVEGFKLTPRKLDPVAVEKAKGEYR